ncbi:IclR family transcriptional regulator C-terminal domain-containing protein [Streptomyces sp. NPDC047072]|uniref:IclR family transcriptional regulator domain-containing protein n=1 Tax=Streptomyces sp. NPDC047072 TaxID=3154809 RepID=UPI0033E4E74F
MPRSCRPNWTASVVWGVAFDDEESQPGLVCVAVPVLSRGGRAVAALSVAGRRGRIDTRRLSGQIRGVAGVGPAGVTRAAWTERRGIRCPLTSRQPRPVRRWAFPERDGRPASCEDPAGRGASSRFRARCASNPRHRVPASSDTSRLREPPRPFVALETGCQRKRATFSATH